MNDSLPDIVYLHAFNSLKGIGPRRLAQIRMLFPSYKEAWNAPASKFSHIKLGKNLEDALGDHLRMFDVSKSFHNLSASGISCVTPSDNAYPALCKEMPDPPPLLYVRGSLRKDSALSIGIVGTRRCSPYGKEVTYRFASRLAYSGVAVISGLARGIDSAAHRATLEADGYTIAVLGSGIDPESIYPRENVGLSQKILASGGALLSEFPPGTGAQKSHFPLRNRIIAGLSHGILVTEAPEKSGAMISAFHAIEYNRDVFAVPGSIYSRVSAGTHKLIRMGAKLASAPEDIFEEYPQYSPRAVSETRSGNNEEKRVLTLLSEGPLHIDALAETMKTPVSSLQILLTFLELSGKIRHLERGTYGKV